MLQCENIILDMDSVIIDSEPLHVQVDKETCEEFGIGVPEVEWDNFKGVTGEEMYELIVARYGPDGTVEPAELLRARRNLFVKRLPTVKAVDGAINFLSTARGHYQRVALTTSTIADHQRLVFDLFDLHSFFDVVVTGDQVRLGKPHPEPYSTTTDRLGIPAEECLVVEDSENGIRSARGAGCKVVALTTSFSREKLAAAGAHLIVDSFAELVLELGLPGGPG